ncbi:MAG: ATP-binding protein [Alphaproteobacteria bacterium]|nr:ATP-binding protein [Alphaproteobacteria bacterium]MBP9878395.1 ATP-binding protein [Alphaproteobacteria bacterium]
MKRYQKDAILKGLKKKMVFLVGPRQAGKTWLAKDIAKNYKSSLYLNYDQFEDRQIIEGQSWLPGTDLIILDELHKMPDWKNYLKGLFDTKPETLSILVTGSACLDIYDQLGDSLAGRYYRHRLLPFSLAELDKVGHPSSVENLMERGGFPEPFLSEDRIEAQRWRMQYINSLLSTDIFELDSIRNIKAFQLVFRLLRQRVGSTISYQSLSEDIGVSPTTIREYIQLLEAIYIIFRVTPFSRNISRSLLKEPKIYFFDIGLVEGDAGARFENFVALSLLKAAYAREDYLGEDCKLHYLRTKDGHEVDFAFVKNQELETMIEVKVSDKKPAASLLYFKNKYNYPAIQLLQHLTQERIEQTVELRRASTYLSQLFL